MGKASTTHWIEGNVGLRVGLDAVKDLKKSLPSPVFEST